jgi:hypothetical protein
MSQLLEAYLSENLELSSSLQNLQEIKPINYRHTRDILFYKSIVIGNSKEFRIESKEGLKAFKSYWFESSPYI